MIGIFDSGIGGLTVARAIEQLLPHHPLLYFGDTARTPYGTKSAETIIDYSLRNGEFLLERGADLIVIACNSASSVAAEKLRQTFDVPVLEVIQPAANKATTLSISGRIGIIGTKATIKSGIYQKSITAYKPGSQVFSQSCPLLVPLVEEGWINKRETKMIIRRYLHPFKDKQIDTLILGCTHYPLLKDLIQARAGKRITLIDSSIEAAYALQKMLLESKTSIVTSQRDQSEPAKHQFFLSDLTESAQKVASKIFGRSVELMTP